MAVYLKQFETQAAYEAAQPNLILPNVSLISENGDVKYLGVSPTPAETRLVCVYNVWDTEDAIDIISESIDEPSSVISEIEIDGVTLPNVVSAYNFDTEGEHTVKFTLIGTTIGDKLFNECALRRVTIPNGITSIGEDVFYNCDDLTSITIPSSVTSIGKSAFGSCRSLTSISIPNGVTSIEYGTFYYCDSLTSITIPSGVTSIGQGAFQYCEGLTSIDIPSGVTSIGERAFEYCSGLTSITVEATTPPTLGEGVFENTDKCSIYVPAASVDTYKGAEGWSEYESRIEAIS
jgi:hypothetical protein